MRIRAAQANDRIVFKIKNDSELEISFSASIGQDDPSQCYISYNGRQVANHGTRYIGSMELWDVPLTEG